ncbi:MAG: DUF5320 domain-containing protein [Candidatus Thermoplasmatota archaeon]|nr:DUF5320 domain-containing protein [Candidatus Thermoplasmatota archaeon]
MEEEWDVDMPGEDMEEALDSSEGYSGEEECFRVEGSGGGDKMPGGDESGPWGRGPMTGRGAGYCAGFETPGFAGRGPGRGFGRGMGRGYAQGEPGRGFGRGMGRGYGFNEPVYHPDEIGPYRPGMSRAVGEPSPEAERAYLENMVKGMETELENIKKRIGELTEEGSTDP